MKRIVYTSQFKKDYRKYVHKPKMLAALNEVLRMLAYDEPIPDKYRPHKLHGYYEGCMECHVQSDFLLIWIDEETDTVHLQRLGSHSELF